MRLPAPRQAESLDPPGAEFTQCGQVWEQFEPVVWNRKPDFKSTVACAPASGEMTIGICRTDGRGHQQWDYCKSAPAAGCGASGKLWFVFCEDLQRETPPTPAPTPEAPAAALAPGGFVAATPPPTLEPTEALTPMPTEVPAPVPTGAPTPAPTGSAPTPLPTAAPSPAPAEGASTTTAIQEPAPSPSAAPAPGIAASSAPTSAPAPLVVAVSTPVEAGATSVDVPSVDGLSEGDCVLIEGGGRSEVVCIAGFGSILLASPTINAYPAGSTVTLLDSTASTSTGLQGIAPAGPAGGAGWGRGATTTEAAPPLPMGKASDHGSLQDDPHVCSLGGECYDIREPSSYTLLRVPYGVEEPDMLKVSAALDTDGVRPCGLYVKSIVLSGSWLGHRVVRIRPHERVVGSSNGTRTVTKTNFSVQLDNSSWRSFSLEDAPGQLAVFGQVAIRYALREQYGHRLEAQSLEFLVGAGGHPAVLTVSQASHQALNVDIGGLRQLGLTRFAGVLGTEGHPASIEEPSRACRAAGELASPDDARRGQKRPGAAPAERAATLSASWQ